MIRLAMLFALLAGSALAAPPPVGSDDYNVMHPYANWVETQHNVGGNWCCSVSDGRPVVTRIDKDGHWQAHVTTEHWPAAKDHWISVPDEKVLHQANPVGVPILWYNVLSDSAYCLAPASAS